MSNRAYNRAYTWRGVKYEEIDPEKLELLWGTGHHDGIMTATFWYSGGNITKRDSDSGQPVETYVQPQMMFGYCHQSPLSRGERFYWLYTLSEEAKIRFRKIQWTTSASYFVPATRIRNLGLLPVQPKLGETREYLYQDYRINPEDKATVERCIGFIGGDVIKNKKDRRHINRESPYDWGKLPADEEPKKNIFSRLLGWLKTKFKF